MEKVSDEALNLLKNRKNVELVSIPYHKVTVADIAADLLSTRKELATLCADAETSQNHNAAVIDPLVTQLRDAGYTGTLSEMVGQACALQEATRWIPVGKAEIQVGKLYYVINGGCQSSATPVATYKGISWFLGSGSVEFTDVTHIVDPETFPLPIPPKGGE